MLNEADFRDWCSRIGLTQAAREAIATIRQGRPARRVGGGQRNVAGRYPSRKMGFTIQFESHRVEMPFIYEAEHDPQVLEFYDQPPSIPLCYRAANGRRLSVMHTPDYFVLREGSASWVECKTEEDLEALAIRSPNRYARDTGSKWRCMPGEEYAATLGLTYEVWSAAQVNWILQRNLQFLEDYLRFGPTIGAGLENAAITDAIQGEPGITLLMLLEDTRDAAQPDDIYILIASGAIYADLNAAPLAEPDRVRLFPTAEMAAACERVGSAAHGSVEIPSTVVRQDHSPGSRSEAYLLLAEASEKDLAVANRRFELVMRHIEGTNQTCFTPPRTLRLWTAQYRSARERYGSGYVGLLPRVSQRGNRTSRLPELSRKLLTQFIEDDYESLKQKSLFASWAALKKKCDELGVAAPSHVTFNAAVRRRSAFEQTLKRKGRRAAYIHSPFYYELTLTTPRHGDRPFEIGHIDHTELDIELVCSQTGRNLGRPWMTVLTDAFSRRCLALYLTFDEPSYRSCMMILRNCVLRHHRLPQIIVVDGGPEFNGIYFETLLAQYECTKKTRPPAKARFGSVCERLFGTANTQFIHNLHGNTQIMRNVRQVTKSNRPDGQAVWTLSSLHCHLSSFLFETYDTIEHPVLGQTPRDAYLAGLRTAGVRTNRMISYDQVFVMATLPSTHRGTSKVTPGRGVKVNGVHYWAEAFRDPSVENCEVAIRYDPFDMGTAYAFLSGRWTECHSEHYAMLHGRSQKEIMIASKEARRRSQLHARGRFTLTARKVADFLASTENEEKILIQQLRDGEGKGVRQNDLSVVHGSTTIGDLPSELSPGAASSCAGDRTFAATVLYGDF
ncbi:MAG: Mu transposase C-terminal domain-containing protein [Terracidiphilus sp.]|jgi:transposase InsO family protein